MLFGTPVSLGLIKLQGTTNSGAKLFAGPFLLSYKFQITATGGHTRTGPPGLKANRSVSRNCAATLKLLASWLPRTNTGTRCGSVVAWTGLLHLAAPYLK